MRANSLDQQVTAFLPKLSLPLLVRTSEGAFGAEKSIMRGPLRLVVFMLLSLASLHGEASGSRLNDDAAIATTAASPALALGGRVTDGARILTPAQEARLSAKLERLERLTKHQMVIVTVPSLGGRDVADFTTDLGNSWGIGREGYDDGVVLLVAPKERKVRIAVGYGLEKRLTDALCSQIINRLILPRFRQGDLPGGIEAGTGALVARLYLIK
jgi:uncharacterized protein